MKKERLMQLQEIAAALPPMQEIKSQKRMTGHECKKIGVTATKDGESIKGHLRYLVPIIGPVNHYEKLKHILKHSGPNMVQKYVDDIIAKHNARSKQAIRKETAEANI